MPIVEVAGYGTVEFPEGTTKAEMEKALRMLPPKPAAEKAAPTNLFADESQVYDPVSGVPMGYGFGQTAGATALAGAAGVLKPAAGAAQFLGINKPAQVLNKLTKTAEDIGGAPATVADIAGQVVSPIPTKVAGVLGKVPGVSQAATRAGQVLDKSVLAKSAAQGAGAAALTPTSGLEQDYADFLAQKAKDVSLGAGLGAVAGKTGQLIFDPKVAEKVKMLQELGMKYFTPGQLMSQSGKLGPVDFGRMVRTAEEAMTSTPITGSLIQHGQEIATRDFNRAMGNQVLKPLNEALPKDVRPGHDMINYLYDKIDDTYRNLEKVISFSDKVSPVTGSTTMSRMNAATDRIMKDLVPEAAENVVKSLNRTFFTPLIGPQGKYGLNGKEFRAIESSLGAQAKTWMSSADPIVRTQGMALRDFQEELRNELARQNPAVGKQLREAHEAFKRYLRVEKAAALRGADEGVFSANQMRSAAESMAGRRATARGTGMAVPETQAAAAVLGKGLPDSGTAARLMTPYALRRLTDIGAMVPLLGAGLIYNKPVMGALTTLATRRPEAMRQLGEPVRGGLSEVSGILAAQPEE